MGVNYQPPQFARLDVGTKTISMMTLGNQTATAYGLYAPASTAAPSAIAFINGASEDLQTPEKKFASLVELWESRNIEQGKRNFNDLAFLQIIGMGQFAIRPLLERVRNRDTKWIYALKCISGQEADKKEMRGDVDQIINAWVAWGIRNGYIE
jgi:hypothetical protein